jgi:hypothetical protein
MCDFVLNTSNGLADRLFYVPRFPHGGDVQDWDAPWPDSSNSYTMLVGFPIFI